MPPDFGQPHLFEWEVHGHRLLVESSLVVFQRERQTPMSLKLVDLNAERPNTAGYPGPFTPTPPIIEYPVHTPAQF